MGSSITGRCNDARSEEMDFTLWFNFDSYYDFGELLSILIILISFPWHEDTPKHNIMSECGRCELSFWSRLASRSISRLIISSNPHISMNGEEIFLLREEGGKPSPAHIVHKSSTYASFTPDLALILTWEPALGLVYVLALFPVHSANLAVCFHCVCCTSHPCPPLRFWVLPLTPFMGSCRYKYTTRHSSSCCCEPLLAKANKCLP